MKNVLFTTTALAALAIGGVASAQGISLFGDARLGLGYNINNDGSANGEEDLRAISRVRFGVNMTGETDSGITFGATIRADNARGGQGDDTNGMSAGNVFVSGSWGTLTYGDTNAADEQWVGDIPGNLSLTGLGDLQETFFISNGGSFGDDTANNFAANPTARPTVRYDFDIAGFGISLSSNRDLTDVVVGAGYQADFGGGSFGIGVGYNNYKSFRQTVGTGLSVCEDGAGGLTTTCNAGDDVFTIAGADSTQEVPEGEQWSAAVTGDWENFGLGVVWTQADSKSNDFVEGAKFGTIGVGGTFGWDAFTVGAYYVNIYEGSERLEGYDGKSAYGLTAAYDLGGGAQVAGGVARTFGRDELFQGGSLIQTDQDADTVADFGIKMAF
ncbi:MAG: porin [Rhodobacteraceae bacterium]|nr:porin [Paracoccaceae bacterium]